ncbi:MAG: hypothetical protein PSX81_05635 [bacterium]|nr:hypothetical protein [bacterium]
MKKKIMTVLFLTFYILNIKGQTSISAGNVSGTWTKAASPVAPPGFEP